MQKFKIKNKKIKNDKNILYTKMINMFKVEVFNKLNMMIHHHYFVYLNKKNKDKFVQDIFSRFFFIDFLYIEVKKNVVKNFK